MLLLEVDVRRAAVPVAARSAVDGELARPSLPLDFRGRWPGARVPRSDWSLGRRRPIWAGGARLVPSEFQRTAANEEGEALSLLGFQESVHPRHLLHYRVT